MSQVTLAHLLAEAMKIEFGGMLRADDPSDWLEAAEGILEKIDLAMMVPKVSNLQYTEVEVNLVDQHLVALGWNPEEQNRHAFLTKLEQELAILREQP